MGRKTTQLECGWCETPFEKLEAEVRRQLNRGREHFFCTLSCGAHFRNADKKAQKVELICGCCGEPFLTTTHNKAAKEYCSKSCASRGKVTDHQRSRAQETGRKNIRHALTPEARQKAMLSREGWKYQFLREHFGDEAVFEHPLPGTKYLFDMALPGSRVLVEFDGPGHQGSKALARDREKSGAAESQGWRVIRVKIQPQTVIPLSVLDEL